MKINNEELSRLLLKLESDSFLSTDYLRDIWHLAYLKDLGFIEVDIKFDSNHKMSYAYAYRITKRGFAYLAQVRSGQYCLNDADLHDRNVAESQFYESQKMYDHALGTLASGGVALSFGIASALGVQKEIVTINHLFLIGAIISWVACLIVMLKSYRASAMMSLNRVNQIDEGKRLEFNPQNVYPVHRRNKLAWWTFSLGCILLAAFVCMRLKWQKHNPEEHANKREFRVTANSTQSSLFLTTNFAMPKAEIKATDELNKRCYLISNTKKAKGEE